MRDLVPRALTPHCGARTCLLDRFQAGRVSRVNRNMMERANKYAALLRKREEQFTRCELGVVWLCCCWAVVQLVLVAVLFAAALVAAVVDRSRCPS